MIPPGELADVNNPADRLRLPADAFLRCGGGVWPVHRTVLAERSPVFSQYFRDAASNVQTTLVIGAVVVSAVQAALRYVYTDDYDDEDYDISEYEKAEEAYPIRFNVYVYAVAIKLRIPGLTSLAVTKIPKRAWEMWEMPCLADAVQEIYTDIPESRMALRRQVLDIFKAYSPVVFESGHVERRDPKTWSTKLNHLRYELPAFADELVAFGILPEDEQQSKCTKCGDIFVVLEGLSVDDKHNWCAYCKIIEKKQEVAGGAKGSYM